MFILNGKPLSPDSAFTHDGVQYPANWMRLSTLEQKAAIGITEQPDPLVWDQRFYWGYDSEGNLIPKQLEDEVITPEEGEPYTQTGLKTQHIQQTKQTANTLLTPTDWYVTRKFERNIEIPVGITSYRATVIAVSEERETLIGLTTSVTELKELYESTYVGIGTSAITQAPAMPQWPNINN
jgi:hypothetical protein